MCRRLRIAVVAAAGCSGAWAQTSLPPGLAVQTIPPGQSRAIAVPLGTEPSPAPGGSGTLTGVGPDYFENAAAAWIPGSLSSAEAPFLVRLTSGRQAGRVFPVVAPANTATRVYVGTEGEDLTALGLETGAAGTSYALLPAATLAGFFGTAVPPDSLVVQAGSVPGQADMVQVWDGSAWLNFYYNSRWNCWARDTDEVPDPSRNHFLLRPDRGIMLARRAPTPLSLAVPGRPAASAPAFVLRRAEQARAFLATGQTQDVTLGELALQDGTRFSGWRGSARAEEADLVHVWGGGAWFSFFFNSAVGHWQRVGDPVNRDGYVIPLGTPIFVQRRQTAPGPGGPAVAPPVGAAGAPPREAR